MNDKKYRYKFRLNTLLVLLQFIVFSGFANAYDRNLGFLGDSDGDGFLERIWGFTRGSVCVNYTEQDPINITTSSLCVAKTADIMGLGEIDGDGFEDILIRDGDQLRYYSFSEDSIIDISSPVIPIGSHWSFVGMGDLNGDGYEDFVFLRVTDRRIVYLENINGTINSTGFIGGFPLDTDLEIEGIGDIDGDGDADIIVQHHSGYVGYWFIENLDRDGNGGGAIGQLGSEWTLWEVADVNLDGTDDVVWYNYNEERMHYWGIESGVRQLTVDINDYQIEDEADFNSAPDSDNDGTPDSVDSCPSNAFVPTTVANLPRSQAQCDDATLDSHVDSFLKGADGAFGTDDDCDQYQLTDDQRMSLQTHYNAVIDQANCALRPVGLTCNQFQSLNKVFHHRNKPEPAGDTISLGDVFNRFRDAAIESGLNESTANLLFTNYPQELAVKVNQTVVGFQNHTDTFLHNATAALNNRVIDPLNRIQATRLHNIFGIDQDAMYCALKASSEASEEFLIGAVIGVEDIPVFFTMLIAHPITTIADLLEFAQTFVLDTGEAIRGFVNIDFEVDDGPAVAFKLGRIFGNFLPDLIGFEALPNGAKDVVAGASETPKVMEHARLSARDVLNEQLSSVNEALSLNDLEGASREARVFINKLVSLEDGANEFFIVQSKFYEFLREVQISEGLGQDLSITLEGSPVVIPKEFLPQLEEVLKDSLIDMTEQQALLDNGIEELRTTYDGNNDSLPESGEILRCP